jgi:hypothetical protein
LLEDEDARGEDDEGDEGEAGGFGRAGVGRVAAWARGDWGSVGCGAEGETERRSDGVTKRRRDEETKWFGEPSSAVAVDRAWGASKLSVYRVVDVGEFVS